MEKVEECDGNDSLVYNLNNIEALGMWIYMLSQPQENRFNKKEIMSRFGIGKVRLAKIIKVLRSHNIIKIVREKNENGKFKSSKYVLNDESEFIFPGM